MRRDFWLALLGLLALLELSARRRGWRGLLWLLPEPRTAGAAARDEPARGEGSARVFPLVAGWLALALFRSKAAAVALAAPAALLIQAGLSSLRNRRLNPLRRLDPGSYPDRVIERIDIPMAEGHLPALHIAPPGATAGVCVLHGSGCDKTYYAWRMADALVSRGIAALLVDLDGHGENPRLQSFPAIVDDARVGAGWLRERYGRVGLVGVSLGGCVAARAVADGLAVDALALLETPPQLFYTREDMLSEALALTEPYLLDLLGESTVYHLSYTVYDLVRVQGGPRIRYTIGTADLIAALDLLGALPRIEAPLLMLYGERDAIVKPALAEQARRAAPQAVFHMVPRASHLTLILHPGALRLVGEWLQQTLEPRHRQ